MHQGIDRQLVLFHNRARVVFFSLYEEMQHTCGHINRKQYENHFQQWQGRCIAQLNEQLLCIAQDIIDHYCNNAQCNALRQALYLLTQAYIHDFTQKVKGL